jgi:uncharacterized protein (UPF0335 family)
LVKVDLDQAVKQFNQILKEREGQVSEPLQFTSQDLVQLFERIMKQQKDYGVITKDMKTSNLDAKTVNKVVALKSIAKDFNVFSESFDLGDDIWIKATLDSIDADAEVICAASQGFMAKLLDTFVTIRRESRVASRLDKEKKGEIFK